MVVIRGLDTKARTLWISTHRDAGKVKDLRANPDAECVVWFEEERIQMRLLAKWRVIDEAAAIRYKALTALRQKAWMSHSENSQQMFLWPAPGKVMHSPNKPSAPIAKGDDNPAPPPPAFTVLVGTLGRIDILQIEQGQHLRYLHAKTKGRWRSQRVTP
jgi:pyridoxine/pyridoxamine 5'-phosphate oxidase